MKTNTKAPTNSVRPFGWQDKLGYAMGDMGCGFAFQLVATYMQLFYLQYIGIDAKDYSLIIILSKAFDAVNDVVIGNLVDTKRIGKKSKYMPWIIFGGIGLVVLTVMIFAPIKRIEYYGVKYAWCLVSYCLWSIAYTMVNVPYGSLHSVITDKPNERQSLSTFRSIGAALPAVIIMLILPDIVYKDKLDEMGNVIIDQATQKPVQEFMGGTLLPVSIVLSIAAFFVLWGTTKLVKERVSRPEVSKEESPNGAKAFFSAFSSFFTNRAMIGLTLATIACVALFNSTMSLNNMVFQYFFADTSKVKLALVVSYAPMIIVMPLIGKLTAKFGKKNLLVTTMLISAIGGIAGMFIPLNPDSTGMAVYIAILLMLNLGNAVFQISVWALVADCIEVSFHKTGKSEEGSLYALYSFFRKLSQGIGQAVVSWGLVAIGFVEGDSAVQPEGFGDNVIKLYIIILMAGSVLAFLSMAFVYNIGKKEELEMANRKTEVIE